MGNTELPILGITLGDPAGVGPEIVAAALGRSEIYEICRPVVLGDRAALEQAAAITAANIDWHLIDADRMNDAQAGRAYLAALSELKPDEVVPGQPNLAGAKAAARYIEVGAKAALRGDIAAIVTAPISKEALNRAGYAYPGHTEMLAEIGGVEKKVMMMAGNKLNVALVTIHTALSAVPSLISVEKIVDTTRIVHDAFVRFWGRPDPRLAVAALNPHAGEGGMFGREEETVILPAILQLQSESINLQGPFPPDTLFYRAANGEFDAVICMYHDQGLIPFKLLHFEDGVNVTLGLPFIRTSVDHGTAYDIAGRGTANPSSLVSAIRLAAHMAKNSR